MSVLLQKESVCPTVQSMCWLSARDVVLVTAVAAFRYAQANSAISQVIQEPVSQIVRTLYRETR